MAQKQRKSDIDYNEQIENDIALLTKTNKNFTYEKSENGYMVIATCKKCRHEYFWNHQKARNASYESCINC